MLYKSWLNLQPREILADENFKPLNTREIQGVEKFVFFTGYPRSGHSIVGSLLDAHPNIVLSYGFFLFRWLLASPGTADSIQALLENKKLFFNVLYERSYIYSNLSSRKKKKGYTLDVPGLWSGNFNGQLKIIGDKSAGPTTVSYSHSLPLWFKLRYECLQQNVGVPLLGIHVVRNPFDMITTHTLYKALDSSWKKDEKNTWSAKNKFHNEKLLQSSVNFFFDKAKAVEEMIPLCGMNVLEIHSEDLVEDPRRELNRMCQFLEVECSEVYLKACENKVYRNVSRTRDKVYWPPYIKAQVIENIQKYSFFRGYTYDDDFYNP